MRENGETDSERIEHATKAALTISLAFVVTAVLTWVLFVPAMHYMVVVWIAFALVFACLAVLVSTLKGKIE